MLFYCQILPVKPTCFCTAMVIFCTFVSCSSLSEKEYLNWCEANTNGLHFRRDVNEVNLDIRYLTPECRWLKGNKLEGLELWKAENRTKHHFILKMNWKVSSKKTTSSEIKYYLSYNLQNDIYLQSTDGTKIPCLIAHLENQQMSGHTKTVHLAFDSDPLVLPELTLVIDSELISSVPVKMHFDLSKLPVLKL